MDQQNQQIKNDETEAKSQIAYGVWIRGVGWLRGKGGHVFADELLDVAQSAAHLYGRGAHVTPIDDALIDLEPLFVERERKSWLIRASEMFK